MTATPLSTRGPAIDSPRLEALWRCPRCRGSLVPAAGGLECCACLGTYAVTGGIPDFRVDVPAWIDVGEDRAKAEAILALPSTMSGAELAYEVFRRRTGWSERDARHRATQVAEQVGRMSREFDDWLTVTTTNGTVLDLGCGAGGVLAALARRDCPAIGIDVSLEWLVVAQRLIADNGGQPVLAAALAEALPLANDSVGAVLSLDVFEHVGDQGRYLEEIDRVLAPDGVCAVATPNRYSFTPEPHVGIWGVGWLPRAWQAGYVKWRGGKSYDFCRLPSLRELRWMFARWTTLAPHVTAGIVPDEEMAGFSPLKARVAGLYNGLAGSRGLSGLILVICPFFRVIARKRAPRIAR